MHEAKEAGLLDGVAIPICGHKGELAGVGMASSAGGIRPDELSVRKYKPWLWSFIWYTD